MSVIILDFVFILYFISTWQIDRICECVCMHAFKTLYSEHLYRYVKFASDKEWKVFAINFVVMP